MKSNNGIPKSNQTPLPSGGVGGGFLFKLIYAIWYALSLLPLRALYVISDVLCLLISRVVKYRHRVIWNNLKVSFPEKSEDELCRI